MQPRLHQPPSSPAAPFNREGVQKFTESTRPGARRLTQRELLQREMGGMSPQQMNIVQSHLAPPPLKSVEAPSSALTLIVITAVLAGAAFGAYRLLKSQGWVAENVKEVVEKAVTQDELMAQYTPITLPK